MSIGRQAGLLAWAAAGWIAAASAVACNVPVFRYALERWPADWYRLSIYHRGALPPELDELAAALKQSGDDGMVNLSVRRLDLDDPRLQDPKRRPEDLAEADLPCAYLQDTLQEGPESVVWKGPFSADALRGLVDSPARRELRQRILGGDSAVWMVLESGDAEKDARVEERLRAESERIREFFEIPEVDPSDPRTLGNPDLQIAFSTFRLSRSDPAERFLLKQLFHHLPSLETVDEPVILPVFGRGRVLCSLRAEDLSQDALAEIAAFLTGPCSCEIKGMNPGVDLMIAADWDALIEDRVVEEPELPPLVSLAALAEQAAAPAAAADSDGTEINAPGESSAAPESAPRPSPLGRNLVILGAISVVILAAGTFVMQARRPRP